LATAQAAVEAAIRLRPQAGESHLLRAAHLYCGYRDYDGALKELDIARQTLPNDPEIFELTGYILRRRGKSEEGLQSIQRALDLDPRNFYTLQQIALSYGQLRRYVEETAVLDRAIAVKPDDVETRVNREVIALDWKADTRPLHRVIDEVRAQNPDAAKNIADSWVLLAFAERNPTCLESALRALGNNSWGDNATLLSVALGEGLLARLQHDEDKAHAAFMRARDEQAKLVEADPNFAPPISVLGLIDAYLGHKKEALEETQRALDLLPVTKDMSNGTDILQYGAVAAACVGEKDLACERLAAAVSHPSVLSYGRLKLLPWWDPLRGDPRFEKIVASQAPK
jgi:tetratricopeptide (TPR) repeat protein